MPTCCGQPMKQTEFCGGEKIATEKYECQKCGKTKHKTIKTTL